MTIRHEALDVSLAVGAHGLPLIGSGDWNDGGRSNATAGTAMGTGRPSAHRRCRCKDDHSREEDREDPHQEPDHLEIVASCGPPEGRGEAGVLLPRGGPGNVERRHVRLPLRCRPGVAPDAASGSVPEQSARVMTACHPASLAPAPAQPAFVKVGMKR